MTALEIVLVVKVRTAVPAPLLDTCAMVVPAVAFAATRTRRAVTSVAALSRAVSARLVTVAPCGSRAGAMNLPGLAAPVLVSVPFCGALKSTPPRSASNDSAATPVVAEAPGAGGW